MSVESETAYNAAKGDPKQSALNAVCPYFTMFPLSFPLHQLTSTDTATAVLDPFCGRGTTLFAARLAGVGATGIDSNPVAVKISRAKLSCASPDQITHLAENILNNIDPDDVPKGLFWELAYSPRTLDAILRLRAGLRLLSGQTADALCAIVLGALHGPRSKTKHSYFSNQMPRTFASKPAYSIKYWSKHNLLPPEVDVMTIITDKAKRYFGVNILPCNGQVLLGDARDLELPSGHFSHVITSPPYFGMRSYVPDQWIRNWFVGGPPTPAYIQPGQIGYEENVYPEGFARELSRVWANIAPACRSGSKMMIRFGTIRSRPCDAVEVIRSSIQGKPTGWRIKEILLAGDAHQGRRQADHMGERAKGQGAVVEYDIACTLD